jgi:hypothetical protein
MKTAGNSETPKNPLRGLGKELRLHIIIPVIYAVILISVFIITHV